MRTLSTLKSVHTYMHTHTQAESENVFREKSTAHQGKNHINSDKITVIAMLCTDFFHTLSASERTFVCVCLCVGECVLESGCRMCRVCIHRDFSSTLKYRQMIHFVQRNLFRMRINRTFWITFYGRCESSASSLSLHRIYFDKNRL